MRALLRMYACLLFIVASVTPAAASPADPDQTRLLSEEADRLGLSDDPQWIKLIHYRRSFLSRDSYQSDIITDAFFLASEGRTDSRAELRSTLAALLSPIGETGNQHAQCRFPARLAWLKRRLSWPEDAPVASCPEFEMWSRTGAVEGISVIFASGHLSNPASFYGHLLVKFNSPGERAAEDLLETTLNYGAVIPPNEGAISYIINGLLGGYNSTFTHLEFFQHNHNYAETQLRDLWEYELDLTPSEVDLIVSHTWEVLGKDNKYYFVLQNCAYRIAELLNLVIEKPLVAPSKLWATPIDVFVRLASAKPGERALVRDITRFPSRQNRFREAYRQLVESERDILTRIVNEDAGDVEQAIQGLGEQSQVRVIETLLSYYTFLETRLDPVPDQVEEEKNSLLLARLKRPPSDAPGGLAQQDPAQQPHTGNRSSLAQVSYLYNSGIGSGVEYRFRLVYADFLSLSPGTLPNSELSMLDVRIVQRQGHVQLRWLDLVKITSLNVSETGLPYDGVAAWNLGFGAGTLKLAQDRDLITFVEGGYGRSFRIGRGATLFGLATARATAFDDEKSYFQGGARIGLLIGRSEVWKASLEGGLWQQLDARQRTIPFARLETRFGGAASWDVRTAVEYQSGYEAEEVVETRLAFSFYW